MNDASEDRGEDFGKIAEKSRRTLLWIQIGEAVLLIFAAVAIIVLIVTVYNDRAKLAVQQKVIVSQQQKLSQITQAQVAEAHRVSNALCDSQFTIGTAPLPPSATKLGVEFVEASRKAFIVLECKGNLGPPPKSLVHLGVKLNVPIRY